MDNKFKYSIEKVNRKSQFGNQEGTEAIKQQYSKIVIHVYISSILVTIRCLTCFLFMFFIFQLLPLFGLFKCFVKFKNKYIQYRDILSGVTVINIT